MAKIAARDLYIWPRRYHKSRVASEIVISRTGQAGNKAFEACIRIGGRTKTAYGPRGGESSRNCRVGRNPRAALKSALASAAYAIGRRHGSFSGYRRRR